MTLRTAVNAQLSKVLVDSDSAEHDVLPLRQFGCGQYLPHHALHAKLCAAFHAIGV